MLYVQNFNCAFVSVIGEVKFVQKLKEENLEEKNFENLVEQNFENLEEKNFEIKMDERQVTEECLFEPEFSEEDHQRSDLLFFYLKKTRIIIMLLF